MAGCAGRLRRTLRVFLSSNPAKRSLNAGALRTGHRIYYIYGIYNRSRGELRAVARHGKGPANPSAWLNRGDELSHCPKLRHTASEPGVSIVAAFISTWISTRIVDKAGSLPEALRPTTELLDLFYAGPCEGLICRRLRPHCIGFGILPSSWCHTSGCILRTSAGRVRLLARIHH